MKKDNLITTIPIRDRNGNVIGEKEVARYAALLARAHEEGLRRITTELIQVPTKDNGMSAIVTAKVETHKGVYEGLGDASPENVAYRVAVHLIRMAETRAKARALRDAVNIGVVALEEIGSDLGDDDMTEETAGPDSSTDGGGNGNGRGQSSQSGSSYRNAPMTDAQRRYLFRLLAERGVGADEARERLHEALGVESLAQATKYGASNLIDQIQRGQAPEAVVAGGEA